MSTIMLRKILNSGDEDKKRKELGIDKARERILMDMADRQALEA